MTGAVESPPDPGIAPPGPGSTTWRIHADPMMWVAGLRALYFQALHPRVIRGFVQNSDYRQGAWGRLARTADYVGTTTFGTLEEARRSGARIRRIHARLTATDPQTGERYRIDDPELLTWVHCCEIDSYLRVLRRSGLQVSAAEADRYVDEQRWRAWLVGADLAQIPTTVGELGRYFDTVRPQLAATQEARAAAEFVARPPMDRRTAILGGRVGWAAVALLAFGTLPGWARRMYDLPGTRLLTDPAVTASLRTMHAALRAVPQRYREGPHVKAARERLAAEGRDLR